MTSPTKFFAAQAWLGGTIAEHNVLITVNDGLIADVSPDSEFDASATRLDGLTLPGAANAHSHAFHRALRGRTQSTVGSFWTWREAMYQVANRLTPDSYFALAKAAFKEMLCAGFTVVGEFHYLHHQPDGSPYSDPNAMSEAVLAAANEAGIRITLLDTLYLHGGLDASGHLPLQSHQQRFSDSSARTWASRVGEHSFAPFQRLGVAAHSVRAVDPRAIAELAAFAQINRLPAHIHLSEQINENEQALAAFGQTPTELIAEAGLLGSATTAVHATHLSGTDLALLGEAHTGSCFCPTTERDLADGVGPSTELLALGSPISLGTDSHAVVDPFEEMRGLEMNERLVSYQRGSHSAQQLATFATANGYQSLGWQGGRIEVGNVADLITIDTDSVRTTTGGGNALEAAVFSATRSDIQTVIVGGVVVVDHGPTTGRETAGELRAVLSELFS